MRIALLLALLASAATPALAQTDDIDRRTARADAREQRSERREVSVRSERAPREARAPRAPREFRVARDGARGPRVTPVDHHGGQTIEHRRRGGSHGGYHRDLRREHRELHDANPSRREHRGWHRDANRDHYRRHARWNTGWRSQYGYNWWDYRNSYGSLYRLGRYYDPYGYGYRRFQIGISIGNNYYGDRYRIDPYRYRLPPAYGPYQWIRYHNDAVLVDTFTGEVADVIYNFFW